MLIAHPTNLTNADEVAFLHAVALAARSGARLATIHAGDVPDSALPRVEPVLHRWSVTTEVKQDRIVEVPSDDPSDTVLSILKRLTPELVVCATHARTPFGRLVSSSVAEAMARNLSCPTLLLPEQAKPFVDARTGQLTLDRIMIPSKGLAEARAGLDACRRLLGLADQVAAEVVLVHAEDGSPVPSLEAPPGLRLERELIAAPLEHGVLDVAERRGASLIVMPSRGHDSLLDVVFGSHTERVLHGSHFPLLWVPLPH